jgi:hypothetical protein
MAKLSLPTVTLCAAASVNVRATVAALTHCLNEVDFAQCLLFTDQTETTTDERIRTVPISRLPSAMAYSDFMLADLGDHIETEHCLVVQWDGFVSKASHWCDEFLSFDYVGAPWPQFGDGRDVGNGGFSLRSRKLLLACRDPDFVMTHPEDVAICRVNRRLLSGKYGIRFGTRDIADRFAFERTSPPSPTFGFHGIFNIIPLFGPDRFWETYQSLDDQSTAFANYAKLVGQMRHGSNGAYRALLFTQDALRASLRSLG